MKSHVTNNIVPLNKNTVSYWPQPITQMPKSGQRGRVGRAKKTQTQGLACSMEDQSTVNVKISGALEQWIISRLQNKITQDNPFQERM